MNWQWVLSATVLALHDRLIAEHGGVEGVRDMGLLESALARPQNRAAMAGADAPDACDLAAAYAWGIARNHPFVDGNKRTAWVVARLFLKLNGVEVAIPPVEAVLTAVALAEGGVSEPELAKWLRRHVQNK